MTILPLTIEYFENVSKTGNHLTAEEWLERYAKADRRLLEPFRGGKVPVKTQCLSCKNVALIKPQDVAAGRKCIKCLRIKKNAKSIEDEYKILGHELLEPYKGVKEKHQTRFRCGREQESIPSSVVYRGYGCGHCRYTQCKKVPKLK